MRKLKMAAAGAAAMATFAVAAPASATIYEYTMKDGGVLTIDTVAQSGSWVSKDLNTVFTSPDFANFTGGQTPSLNAVLTSLDGTRIVHGKVLTDNPKNIDTTHPQVLKTQGDNKFNLWAWWGDPIKAGDYVRRIESLKVTEVPAPGMFGLFAMALALLGFGRFRRGGAARRPKAAGLTPAAA